MYGEILELEAKMQKIFQVKTYSWESTQYEDVRGFGFSIRLLFNSLALSIHSSFCDYKCTLSSFHKVAPYT